MIAGFVLGGCSRPGAPPPASVHQTFENSDEGWIPYGPDARIEVTQNPPDVKSGKSSLAIHYTYNPGQYGSAVLPLELGELSQLGHIGFWVKTDLTTAVIVVLTEKQPGGSYSAWFWAPRDRWQHVELTPADFSLNMGPNDPKDPNGRLDLDRIQGMGISDLGQAFHMFGSDPNYALVVTKPSGQHGIYIDDVEFIRSPSSTQPRIIGPLDRGFLTWITMGGADLAPGASGNPLGEPALEVRFQQMPGRYAAISHGIANLNLAGVTTLNFEIAAASDCTLMAYLEEKKPGSYVGPRYSQPLAVTKQRRQVSLRLSDFHPDTTGPADPNGRLDPEQLKSISFVGEAAANTVWISAIRPQ